MSDLRLKIGNKIYTSGNKIVDTKNNNNAIVVFLGASSSQTLKPYIDSFMEDTLKSQISKSKISVVEVSKNDFDKLPEKMMKAVKESEFSSVARNELFISFVTIMDDELYEEERKIDITAIETLKTSILGGYSVEISYDFYGIFVSNAKYSNRLNARKMIVDFLSSENGGVNTRKKVYHQACPGDDYYKSAKSIAFMVLVNLIEELEPHTAWESVAEGNNYTWTTFSLIEKNLAALVIYEMINKLLENQINGVESISSETMSRKIKDAMDLLLEEIKQKASVTDVNYIPIPVRITERKLTAVEKALNVFKKEKETGVEIRRINEEDSIFDLLEQQKVRVNAFLEEKVTDAYADALIRSLIKLCTVISSISIGGNEGMVLQCLKSVKNEYVMNENSMYGSDYFLREYNKMLSQAAGDTLDKIIRYYENHVGTYMTEIQTGWNAMNQEVNKLIKEFAEFQDHFEGIGDLLKDKTVPLLCDYDEILNMIDVRSVIKAINGNSEIYSSILNSYYANVLTAGEIAKTFGNRNILPENEVYCLYSAMGVACPGKLKIHVDEYWFRDHEIAIVYTAKNRLEDCDNLPFGN